MRMGMVYEEEEEGGREGWRCEEDGGARWRYEEGARRYKEESYEEDGDGVRGGGWMEV